MKSFSYTARDKQGSFTRGTIQANNRAIAVELINQKGFIPISVSEKKEEKYRKNILLLSISGIAILGILFFIFVISHNNPKSNSNISKEQHSISLPIKEINEQKQVVSKPQNMPLKTPSRSTALQPEQNKKRTATTEINVNEYEENLDIKTNEVGRAMFDSDLEQVLHYIVNTVPGDMPTPLPRVHPKTNIGEVLNRDIILYDTDDEWTEQMKSNVALAKQELKKYLEEGGEVEDFLTYYHDQLVILHKEWRTSQKHLMGLIRDGDFQSAKIYLDQENKVRNKEGLKPLIVPPAFQK